MFGLEKLFGKEPANGVQPPYLDKDAIAELLRVTPEALDAFEAAYSKLALDSGPDDNFFQVNSRQASAQKQMIDPSDKTKLSHDDIETAARLTDRIVAELLSQTSVYIFDGHLGRVHRPLALPAGTSLVSNDEIKSLPMALRPELTGELMKVDITEPAYHSHLYFYQRSLTEKNPKKRALYYEQFRRGLDILDLDKVSYEIIGTNRNSMGHWFPQLVESCRGQGFFKLPATIIAKVPLTLLQLTRQQYEQLTPTTLSIVDKWAYEAFRLMEEKEYFIKTGTYSSKFDFRNAYVHGAKEVRELGEYLLFIHYQALCMSHYTVKPAAIYGASTTNEWVVREFIPDKENNPCIYMGLPLHTEYRVFVDCDDDKVIGVSPYWDPETMKRRFGHGSDADSPHKVHDYIIYKAHEETLMRRYHENVDAVVAHIADILPSLDLKGQWSIDVMQNGDDFWIIDMAIAEQSAFYDCVPKELRRPSKEDWIPRLPEMRTNHESE